MHTDKLVEVYVAKDAAQAHFMQSVIEDSGIFTHIVGEILQVAAGELPLGIATAPRIMVFEKDVPRVRKIIEELEKSNIKNKK